MFNFSFRIIGKALQAFSLGELNGRPSLVGADEERL